MGFALDAVHEVSDFRAAVRNTEAVFVGGNTFRHLLATLYELDLLEPIRRRLVRAALGVNPRATFAGSDGAAVVDGDFAMRESELQGVLKALRGAGISIVAIHNHMISEEPRIVFTTGVSVRRSHSPADSRRRSRRSTTERRPRRISEAGFDSHVVKPLRAVDLDRIFASGLGSRSRKESPAT
jgi:hypothetical protein